MNGLQIRSDILPRICEYSITYGSEYELHSVCSRVQRINLYGSFKFFLATLVVKSCMSGIISNDCYHMVGSIRYWVWFHTIHQVTEICKRFVNDKLFKLLKVYLIFNPKTSPKLYSQAWRVPYFSLRWAPKV